MNELNCKLCDTAVECEDDVVAITCSTCCVTIGLNMEEE